MNGLQRPGDVFMIFGEQEKKRKENSRPFFVQVPLHRDASRRSIHIGRAVSA
jgi:hypothetical protein